MPNAHVSLNKDGNMNDITIEQASKWLAITNLGGPFMVGNPNVGATFPPKTGEDIDAIWQIERNAADSDRMFDAFEAERKCFEKFLRGRKPSLPYRKMLAAEGFNVKG